MFFADGAVSESSIVWATRIFRSGITAAGRLARRPAPALIITAEYDPHQDAGAAYAEKLNSAGVATTPSNYDGQVRAFFQVSAILDGGRRAVEEACAALWSALAYGLQHA